MLYLGDEHIRTIGLHWEELVNSIEVAVRIIDAGDYAQPIKPYLRYHNPANRIIAMPAFIGGSLQTAGVKWIASFPGNIEVGLPRAHSITLLNNADTGIPYAMLSTPLPSAARTAAVSGLLIRHYLKARNAVKRIKLGIIGFGPVGRLHYDMCCRLFGDVLDDIQLYDIRGCELHHPDLVHIDAAKRSRTTVANSWQQLYKECNIIITCTVSTQRYIDRPPAAGCLLLDVSLRDYSALALHEINAIIVDDWEEACRENTDIEMLHLARGLTKEQTSSLADVVCRGVLAEFSEAEPVLFCPMGMAVFDMTIADYFVQRAQALGVGMYLK